MHDQSSECASPTIAHSDQTTYQAIANAHNNSITWGNNLTMILPRSRQDLPTVRTMDMTPTNVDLSVQILHWWYSHIKSHLPKQENRVE